MAWPDRSFCQDAATRREATADAIRALDATQVRLLPGSPFYDRQELHRHGYLASFDADRLLFHYRALAKLPQPPGVKPYDSWDSGFIRGHMTGHYMSAASRMAAETGDQQFRDRVNYIVAELAKCQDALKLDGYLAAFPVAHSIALKASKAMALESSCRTTQSTRSWPDFSMRIITSAMHRHSKSPRGWPRILKSALAALNLRQIETTAPAPVQHRSSDKNDNSGGRRHCREQRHHLAEDRGRAQADPYSDYGPVDAIVESQLRTEKLEYKAPDRGSTDSHDAPNDNSAGGVAALVQ